MTKLEPQRKAVRRWLSRLGFDGLTQLLQLQAADMGSKGTGKPGEMAQFAQLRQLMQQLQAENACLTVRDLALNGHDLMALGYTGPAIGLLQRKLLELVLDECVPNEKAALQAALQQMPL